MSAGVGDRSPLVTCTLRIPENNTCVPARSWIVTSSVSWSCSRSTLAESGRLV
jgi:hypothetical protein